MGRGIVEARWQEYLRAGEVIVKASPTKGVLSMVGLALLGLLSAVMSSQTFSADGLGSLRGWILALFALICLGGAVWVAGPMVRGRQLRLTPGGVEVSRRGSGQRSSGQRSSGERVREMSLAWQEIEQVAIHHNRSSGTTRVDVRMHLVPGGGRGADSGLENGYVDLPTGFAMTRKDLVALLERIRLSQAQQQAGPHRAD